MTLCRYKNLQKCQDHLKSMESSRTKECPEVNIIEGLDGSTVNGSEKEKIPN